MLMDDSWHTIESCHTYEWVTSQKVALHIGMSHVTRLSEPCLTHENALCGIDMCQNNAFTCVRRDSDKCVTWLIPMCDMTHSYMWHDSLKRVTWLIPTGDMTHCYVWHDSLLRVTWLIGIYKCLSAHMNTLCEGTCSVAHRWVSHVTHYYVWHDSLAFICAFLRTWIPSESCHTCKWVMSHT